LALADDSHLADSHCAVDEDDASPATNKMRCYEHLELEVKVCSKKMSWKFGDP
jgi:hypothetical protein